MRVDVTGTDIARYSIDLDDSERISGFARITEITLFGSEKHYHVSCELKEEYETTCERKEVTLSKTKAEELFEKYKEVIRRFIVKKLEEKMTTVKN